MTARDEGGFTLLELIIAMTILGLILVALTFSVTQGFEHSTSTREEVDRANVTRFVARYFAEDVASSLHEPEVPGASCGTGTPVVAIESDPAAPTKRITYVLETSASQTKLVRRICIGGTPSGEYSLGRTHDAFTAVADCDAATCSLTVTWTSPQDEFAVRGSRRVTVS